ncbi:MAG TPA: N-acetylmuramoyl-L-alanine amidase [Acidimicrobiales bacterium]|nr:N-acetylmuramoyl-L-alanine amidase [Acidimicrobiales bacterium]
MRTTDLSPLARLAIGCLALVAVTALIASLLGGDDDTDADAATTSTTTAPNPFGPVPAGGPGAVRTEGGLLLPISGGEPGAWTVLTPCAQTAVVDGEHVAGAHVVIDPGHGGEETGAIGPSSVVEAELNLDVAKRAAQALRDAGATVALTRTDETRVTLRTRAAIARSLDPLVFISIHHNGGPTSPADRPGVQVYHQHRTPGSARLAGLLFEQLQTALAPFSDTWSGGSATGVRARLGTDGNDFYGILREAGDVPAVLAEALYLSHEPEASLLLEPDVRQAEADAIAAAVLAWVETGRAGSGHLPPLTASESAGGGGGTAGCDDPAELAGSVAGG